MLRQTLRKFKFLRKAKSSLESIPGNVGALFLKNNKIRSLLNDTYNTNLYNTFLLSFLGKPKTDAPFNWKIKFRGKEILFPVLPDLDRSWNAALVWGWIGNKQFRTFYEFYLENNPSPSVFWDVGANDGTHSYLFASQGFKCASFEPQPSCIGYIQKVIEANNFDNIEVVQTALGNQDGGSIDFYTSESSWYSSINKESVERFEEAIQIKVPITKIESYWHKSKSDPDLIKIDVEGFEWEVIEGGAELFQGVKPVILIEIDMSTGNFEKIFNFFEPLGYKMYRMIKDKPSDFIAEAADVAKMNSLAKKGNVDFIILPASDFRGEFEQRLVDKTSNPS